VHRLPEKNLGFVLLNVGTEDERLPAAKTMAQGNMNCAKVAWVGFTDESVGRMPCALLPSGLLVGLSAAADWRWVALLDVKAAAGNKKLKYWPINVFSGGLVAISLLDRADAHPAVTLPKPVPSIVELQMPLVGLALGSDSAKKYEFEAEANLGTILLEQRQFMDDSAVDVAAWAKNEFPLLKNFVYSVKAKNGMRALGVAKRFKLLQTLEKAIDMAERDNADTALVERLIELKRAREDEELGVQAAADEAEEDANADEAAQEQRLDAYEEGDNGSVVVVGDDNADFNAGEQVSPASVTRMRNQAPPANPFLVQSSPSRHKEESPTRSSKVPKLSRQSSFSVNARLQSKLNFA